MNESEWLKATTLTKMLGTVDNLREKGYWRQCAFFVCGWVRLNWQDLVDERSRRAIEICELFQDGQVDSSKLQEANLMAHGPAWEMREGNPHVDDTDTRQKLLLAAMDAAWVVSHDPFDCINELCRSNLGRIEESKLCDLLRDTFGNPFRTLTVNPGWLTSTVVGLAEGIYQERAFDRLPILAEALQDAGCDNPDILNHCRDAGQVHVRGCWVIDLLTGRE